MRFPLIDQVGLPVRFERYVAGKLHPDGRRYLPQLVFKLPDDLLIGVVDRHHYVEQRLEGQVGTARLVFLLSNIALQAPGEQRQGCVAESNVPGQISTAPPAYGQIVAVPSWEVRRGELSYDNLYAEFVLDVGYGTVGVRTSITADDLAAKLGKPRFEVGDWVSVSRSRIDILAFDPQTQPASNELHA